jgi:hypothetical protein
LYPITPRELAIAAPLLALAILFGVYPQALLSYMTPTIDRQAETLAEWTKNVKEKDAAENQPPAQANMEHKLHRKSDQPLPAVGLAQSDGNVRQPSK